MRLTFCGANGTVTGSKYLIEHGGDKFLVDCGMYQGHRELRQRNWSEMPFEPSQIKAVILTHAHIDHTGLIPLLVKNGFRGNIYCSAATFELCKILLPDSGFLHEEDAKRANKYGYTRHQPALPLYTKDDALKSLEFFQTHDYGTPLYLNDSLRFVFSHSGHILGSSFITLTDGDQTIIFSGDLGRPNDAMMRAPAALQHTDYLVLESTYGNRLHSTTDPLEEIGDVIRTTSGRGGTVVIPSFAVGRAQSILHYIHLLKSKAMIPDLPIYLDSPMAINATKLLCQFSNEHKLSDNVCEDICEGVRYVRTVEESKSLNAMVMPCVIISASGMATGGRVLHHLKHYITDPRNTIMFAGFQESGTRGARLLRGEDEIKIHGEMFPVKAEIRNIASLSAHADYNEILSWLENFKQAPRTVFLTHGDSEAAESLREHIEAKFGWNVEVPTYLESFDL